MHDESHDDKPHPSVPSLDTPPADTHESLSIWFFCGILTLGYGIVLVIQGILDLSNPPHTVLAELHPTLLWGSVLFLFGAFYTIRFRPGKG
jgi:hypothetical protein